MINRLNLKSDFKFIIVLNEPFCILKKCPKTELLRSSCGIIFIKFSKDLFQNGGLSSSNTLFVRKPTTAKHRGASQKRKSHNFMVLHLYIQHGKVEINRMKMIMVCEMIAFFSYFFLFICA